MYAQRISEIEGLIRRQEEWRASCINLIASENVLSRRARVAGSSDFAHRYAEGHPGERPRKNWRRFSPDRLRGREPVPGGIRHDA